MATKKVQPKKNAKKERKQKPILDISEFSDIVNEDGLFTAVPEYEIAKFRPLTKSDFASTDVFLDYRATILEFKSKTLAESAQNMRTKADRLRKFGDEDTRKKVEKAARLRKQFAALSATLADDGIDINELLDDDGDDAGNTGEE